MVTIAGAAGSAIDNRRVGIGEGRMRISVSSALGFTILLSAARLTGEERPPHPDANEPVGIQVVTYEGDGCTTATPVITDDKEAFTLIFDDFITSVQPGGARKTKRKCKVTLQVTVPKGWTYALSSVDFRGYAMLEAGVSARQLNTYHIQGEGPERSVSLDTRGPLDDTFAVRDVGGPVVQPQFARCGKGKFVKITTDVTVERPPGDNVSSGFLALDSVDGQVYHMLWKRCP
jgi:Domain of unknown function (DUF4360)